MQAKRIPLRNRNGDVVAEAVVDAADYETLIAYAWHIKRGYAARSSVDGRRHAMHREILGLVHGDNTAVDHINRDRLDNRRANLRVVEGALENMQNLAPRNHGTSQYRGVHWDKVNRR